MLIFHVSLTLLLLHVEDKETCTYSVPYILYQKYESPNSRILELHVLSS